MRLTHSINQEDTRSVNKSQRKDVKSAGVSSTKSTPSSSRGGMPTPSPNLIRLALTPGISDMGPGYAGGWA